MSNQSMIIFYKASIIILSLVFSQFSWALTCPEGERIQTHISRDKSVHQFCIKKKEKEDVEAIKDYQMSPELKDRLGTFEIKYPDGVVKSRGQYKNGLPHGLFTFFYPDGTLKKEGHYDQGKMTGLWKRYHRNGKLQDMGNWQDNQPVGEWLLYDQTGKTASSKYFEDPSKWIRKRKWKAGFGASIVSDNFGGSIYTPHFSISFPYYFGKGIFQSNFELHTKMISSKSSNENNSFISGLRMNFKLEAWKVIHPYFSLGLVHFKESDGLRPSLNLGLEFPTKWKVFSVPLSTLWMQIEFFDSKEVSIDVATIGLSLAF